MPEVIVEPDGDEVDGGPVLLEAYHQIKNEPTTKVGA